jgi:flagella basal body P-ring formation protein FlgA
MEAMRIPVSLLALLISSASLCAIAADPTRQSLDALRVVAERFVRAQLGDDAVPGGKPARLQVQVGALDERLRLGACGAPQAALPAGAHLAPRMTIALSCPEPRWAVYVPVSVQSEVSVLVARHALPRNAAPAAADLDRQTRWVPGFAHLYVTDLATLAGRHLRIPVSQGAALTVDAFAADVLVKRGQRVTLLATAGGFEVRAAGEALADSGAGGRVRVQNLSSHQVVEGVAESATLVRVN